MKKNTQKFSHHLFRSVLTSGLALAPLVGNATEGEILYTVKPKDVLTSILHEMGYRPIYGKKGGYQLTLVKNPTLARTKGHLIRPGQVLTLPAPAHHELAHQDSSTPTSVVRTPASVEEKNPDPEVAVEKAVVSESPVEPQSLGVEVNFSSGFSKLSGKDESNGASANLLSKSNTGWGIALTQNLTSSFFLSGSYQRTNIEFEDTGANNMLNTNKFSTSKFTLGAGIKSQSGSSLSLNGVAGNLPYFFATAPGSLKLVSSQYSGAGVDGKLNLFNLGSYKVFALGGANMLFPSSPSGFTAKNGSHFNVGLSSVYSKGNFGLALNPYYEEYRYDSSLSTQSLKDLGFRIKLQWDWK